MKKSTFLGRLETIPVPILSTMGGAITLSNYMHGFGFEWVRHATTWTAIVIFLCYLGKIILFPKTCANEYNQVIFRSLYPGFLMLAMSISAYLLPYIPKIAKSIWLWAIMLHACYIVYFTYRTVIKEFTWDTFMPSWFVTYNGILVSTVVGKDMNEPFLAKCLIYYGITVYVIILPFMLYRLNTKKINVNYYHTQAVILAPSALCLTSYLNFMEKINIYLVIFLYISMVLALGFVIWKLPKFFSLPFAPGYASLTFPMAIATMASDELAIVLGDMGLERVSHVINQIAGFQLYITTMIIGYVLLQFLMKLIEVEMPVGEAEMD